MEFLKIQVLEYVDGFPEVMNKEKRSTNCAWNVWLQYFALLGSENEDNPELGIWNKNLRILKFLGRLHNMHK